MRSFFTAPENVCGNEILITEDARHIKRVLRMKNGDEALCFDGTGAEYKVRLLEIGDSTVRCEVLEKRECKSEPRVKVSLFQGIAKADKMELIIKKCTELGVYEVIPVKMDRCVAKIDKAERIDRFNKISREAAKQSGRGIAPKVLAPVGFEDAVALLKEKELSLMPYEVLGHSGQKGLKKLLKENSPSSAGIIIGPEGGFSDAEAAYAIENGINAVGLGTRILRTETAGAAVLTALMYEYNEL